MHLIPLIKYKILVKEPSVHSFSGEDKLSVNLEYKSNLYRNKIPVMGSKINKETETTKVEGKVEDDRRYAIEAAIIKVMKTHKEIDFQSLISNTAMLLRGKFQPDPATIKKRLEQLIERDFIERDEHDKRIFKYIA